MPAWIEPLPWHAGAWQGLTGALSEDRFPHALLISGPQGLGKVRLAEALSARLLCAEVTVDTSRACGVCHSCRLISTGAHPDFSRMTLASGKKVIAVEQVRELIRFLEMTPSLGGAQVALIQTAHLLTESAANALLKTLEEPADGSYLLLVSESPGRLPATVLSRCQLLRVRRAGVEQAVEWLSAEVDKGRDVLELAVRIAQGRPLAARGLLDGDYLERREKRFNAFAALAQGQSDALEVAAQWAREDVPEILEMVIDWLQDLLRLVTARDADRLQNSDLARELHTIVAGVSPVALFGLLDEAREARRLCESSAVRQLLLEDLLLRWEACAAEAA